VTCPVHGSVFSLVDGGVRRGPATRPVQAFEARVNDGMVEVRPRP
jgi:nitrite reductase/ring-hydroxylating ferredoxin subunit